MSSQRPLSSFEFKHFDPDARWGDVPKAGVPLFVATTVRGEIDPDVMRRVLAELAADHALLRAVMVNEPGSEPVFRVREEYQPPLEVTEWGPDGYQRLVNIEQDWSTGLFKAHVLREGGLDQIVLIMHHGMCDGRSALALRDDMWQRYGTQLAGSPLPPSNSDNELVDGIDTLLAGSVTEAEVDELVAMLRGIAAAGDAVPAPLELPRDGDGVGDPVGRFATQRIEVDPEQSAAFFGVARAQGVSVNSLVTGMAMVAVRSQLEADSGPVPMVFGHAVDLRASLAEPIPQSTLLNCAGGVATPVFAAADTDPIELAKATEVAMRAALDARFPALFMRASQRAFDPETAAIFGAQPTLGMANLGVEQTPSIPGGLEFVSDEAFGMAKGMPPKLTVWTVAERLVIHVNYDTTRNSHALMGRVTEAIRDQVRRICDADADRG
ncbi:hypothetical protein [Nocardia sp. NPDC059239]|uniref:phthiocerol/phthiodiolone dimycocerosyl transferase family protein n=1 Tax=unclassified Nocardia TaxID=2637762 RepID=UPI0036877356